MVGTVRGWVRYAARAWRRDQLSRRLLGVGSGVVEVIRFGVGVVGGLLAVQGEGLGGLWGEGDEDHGFGRGVEFGITCRGNGSSGVYTIC